MGSTPQVVLIVPCYYEATRFDPEGFEALIRAGDRVLLFVNDGSTDSTGAVLRVFCDRFPGRADAARMRRGERARGDGGAAIVASDR